MHPALGASGTGPLGPGGFVLATDRSARAIEQVLASSGADTTRRAHFTSEAQRA